MTARTFDFHPTQYARLLDGRKRASIRRGIINIPPGMHMASCANHVAVIVVSSVEHKTFAEIDQRDADAEGYDTPAELVEVLHKIYPTLDDNSPITVIHIERISWHD